MGAWEILLGCVLGLTLAAAWLAVLAPARLRASAEAGRGVPAVWSFLLSWGPVALGGESVPQRIDGARFSFYLLSIRVFSQETSLREQMGERGEESEAREVLEGALSGYRKYDESVGVLETLRFFVRERRRVVIDELAGRVRYGFEDFEKTGELNGYLWALRGMLGPVFNIHHEPDWSGRPVLAGAGRVALRVYPALLALDILLFALRSTARKAPTTPEAARA